ADPVVLSYQRNFIRASMSTKIELLNDASRISTVNMTPLYLDAMQFVLQTLPVLGTDSQLMDLAAAAAQRVAAWPDQSVLPVLKVLFENVPDPRPRIACLETFAVLASDNEEYIGFLSDWLSTSLDALDQGKTVDLRSATACAAVLGKMGSVVSFPVLFRGSSGQYDTGLVKASETAVNQIQNGYADAVLGKIADRDISIVHKAFSLSRKKSDLSSADSGRIAEAVFSRSVAVLSESGSIPNRLVSQMMTDSMEQLTRLKWSNASPMVVKYFYAVQGEYKTGKASVESLVPVVGCLGAMGTNEAAQALSIFLGLLNSETEQKKTFNEQLMLALIQALGDLGDKTAFDYLLYVGYLEYPESVKKASRDALARLQW
ncbi:MAG TPA: hypothetical protein PL077_05340, partial [Treponemataceae bacterium]|nr:hypothetical protein [Treponemataceae bacterium]